MFKKVLCIFLVLILIFTVAACNTQGGSVNNSSLNKTTNSSLINQTSNFNYSSNIVSTTPSDIYEQITTSKPLSNRIKRFYDNNGSITTSYITPAELLDIVEKSSGVLLTDVYYFAGPDNNVSIKKDILSIDVTLTFLLENYNTQLKNIKNAGFIAFTPAVSSNNTSKKEDTKLYFKKDVTINNQVYESVITVNSKSDLSYEINNKHVSTIPFLNLHFFDINFEINAKNPYKVYLNNVITGPNQRCPMPINRDLLCFNTEKTIKNNISKAEFIGILEEVTNIDFPGVCTGIDTGYFCANDNYAYLKCFEISFYIKDKNTLIKEFEKKGFKKTVFDKYITIFEKYDPKNKEFLYFTISTDYYTYTSETLLDFKLEAFVITKNRSNYKTYFQNDAIVLSSK